MIELIFEISLLLGGLLCLWSLWKSTYWWRHGIKTSSRLSWPLCGNMMEFFVGRKHFGQIYREIYNSNHHLAYVGMYRMFGEPAVLIRSQEVLKEIMIRNFQHFQDNVLWVSKQRDPIIHCNPFVAKGEQWRQMRSELVPIFTPNKVKLSFPHIKPVCEKLTKYVKDNLDSNCFEAKNLFSKFTIDVMASSAFSLNAQAFEDSKSDFTTLVDHLFLPNPWSLLDTVALLFSPNIGHLISYHYVPTSVQSWLKQIIEKVLQKRIDSKTPQSDFIQWLSEAREKVGEKPNSFHIVGHSSTFLLEGFETSSSLMAFALFEYAKNPSVQKRIKSEIDEVLGRYNGEICYEAIQEMTYLEASLFETLRFYPPMQALLKHCTKPFELPPQDGKSKKPFKVTKGMVFVVPVVGIHNDADIYENPSKFMPERFMDQSFRQGMGCKFLGFGEGPRMCPGMRFGLAQSKAGIVALLAKYSVQLAPKGEANLKLSPTTFLTAASDGIWISFSPRNDAKWR